MTILSSDLLVTTDDISLISRQTVIACNRQEHHGADTFPPLVTECDDAFCIRFDEVDLEQASSSLEFVACQWAFSPVRECGPVHDCPL